MHEYLDSLPRGIDSYPDYKQKAVLYRQFLKMTPLEEHAELFPERISQMVLEPDPVSAWVPSVHVTALCMASRDLVFETDKAFVKHWYHVNKAVLQGPIYKVLMIAAGPELVLRGAERRWSSLHNKLRLRVSELGKKEALVTVGFPIGLMPRLIAEGTSEGFRAILEGARAKDIEIELQEHSSTQASIRMKWG